MSKSRNRNGETQDRQTTFGIGKVSVRLKNKFVGRCKANGIWVREGFEALCRSDEAMAFLFEKAIFEDQEIKKRKRREQLENSKEV